MALPEGAVFDGQLVNGKMHGEGCIKFADGSEFRGVWNDGKLQGDGKFFFADGLQFSDAWRYCTESDRRFWTEIESGIRLSDHPQWKNDESTVACVPSGCYDIQDGYFNPKDGKAYHYDHSFMRVPTDAEIAFFTSHCPLSLSS